MKQIPLYRREGNGRWGTDVFIGKYALVDDEDYNRLMEISPVWRPHSAGYAYAKTSLLMHRVILGLTDSKIHTDHTDHNRLNNQRSNIVACTQAENNKNLPFSGVGKYKNKWRAWSKNPTQHLGLFVTQEEAGEAVKEWLKTGKKNTSPRQSPLLKKSPCCNFSVVRNGKYRGIQRYRCNNCKNTFKGELI